VDGKQHSTRLRETRAAVARQVLVVLTLFRVANFCFRGRNGGTLIAGSPADFEKLIVDETEKWGKVVKFAGIKAD